MAIIAIPAKSFINYAKKRVFLCEGCKLNVKNCKAKAKAWRIKYGLPDCRLGFVYKGTI